MPETGQPARMPVTSAAIALIDGMPGVDRAACTLCMDCVEACPSGALEISGTRMTLDAVVEESCKDELFYTNSGGGVTLSGGEPLAQPEFSRLFMKACKDRSLHTALDTSGHATWPILKSVLEYTDLVLFDLKHLSPQEHLEGTQAQRTISFSRTCARRSTRRQQGSGSGFR